ncbi:MAG: hypothetical protein IJB97_02850 [Clostridia bacterium]|nr:hypothetical protein [Clostridia bacterium]
MKIGKFIDKKREFLIENMHTVRPLKNFIWNDITVAELDQFCWGESKACVDNDFRQIVKDLRLVYVKDRETGEIYDINRNFKNLPFDQFHCRVGLGYQTTESSYKNLDASLTVLIPEHGYMELHKVTLKNAGNTPRKLSVYSYARPLVNLGGGMSCQKGGFSEMVGGLFFLYHAFRCNAKLKGLYYNSSEQFVAYSTRDGEFFGYGSPENPEYVKMETLPSKNSVFEKEYCVAMQFDIELAAGEEKSIYFVVGTAQSEEESAKLGKSCATKEFFEKEYEKQKAAADEYIDKITIDTPDEYLNSLVNIWLKRQISLGKTWGRIYGKGFRDLLQDITGFVSFGEERAKERLIYTLEHQFISGNGLRQFDPVVDYPYQDMPVWIPMAVLAYIKESGNWSVLDEAVGYYDSDETESVFRHLQRGIEYLYNNQGEHGLGLWRGGDWNDSINNCGMLGKGESVWLSIATIKATDDYVEILENSALKNAERLIAEIREKQAKLKASVICYGFEKDHFIYGVNDWGEKIGSYECEEGRMFLNPQTWAVMAKIFDEKRLHELMDFVEKNLKCDYGYMQNVPAYTKPNDRIGRITYMNSGIYENGSVYNHGVMFKIVADCLLGRAENAYETIKMIRYDNPLNENSGVEPYAISNMYFGPSVIARKGFAPCAWITGSAGWLYRAVTEYILGIKADFYGLKIEPCLPPEWETATAERTFRGARYLISYQKGEKNEIFVDGERLAGNVVPIFEKDSVHSVKVIF